MFLEIIKVDSGTAQRIAQSLQMLFTEVRLTNWMSKLVALGADGASVNMGESGGVGAIIKKDIPHLIHIHCIAHKLEVAVLDACTKVTYIVKFQTTNKTLLKYFIHNQASDSVNWLKLVRCLTKQFALLANGMLQHINDGGHYHHMKLVM